MMNYIVGCFAMFIYVMFGLGNLYWLFLSFQIGSFWMFILGVFPPTVIVSGLTGAYSLLFDVPNWVYAAFA